MNGSSLPMSLVYPRTLSAGCGNDSKRLEMSCRTFNKHQPRIIVLQAPTVLRGQQFASIDTTPCNGSKLMSHRQLMIGPRSSSLMSQGFVFGQGKTDLHIIENGTLMAVRYVNEILDVHVRSRP